jgi:hypothetical protein
VERPGECLALSGKLGPWSPARQGGGPASAWIIDLGGDDVPCDGIEVEIRDPEFARDYRIERGGPPDSREGFRRVASGVWRRRAGEPPEPLEATFKEVRASRLRLVIIDYGNDPLDVRSVEFSAPARQVVFARPEKAQAAVRLYCGNPKAEAPHYDFARNLPEELEPSPWRAELGPRRENPTYVPEPLPFTERWPWAIYAVLGSVSLVLGVIVVTVARTAIAVHDAGEPADVSNPVASSSAIGKEDRE